MNRWKNAARKFYDPKHNSVYESWGPARKINGAVWRALGLLPWNKKFVWLSKTYQLFFFAVLLASTLLVLAKVESVSFQGTGMDSVDMFPRMDKIVAVGSLLAVSTSFWKYQAYMESQHLVESYLSRAGFLVELDWKSCVENGLLFLLWLCCVVSMFFGHGFELHLYHVGFAFNVLTLFGACAYVIRLCRGLHFAVDSFCQYITEINFDFDDAMQEWFLLHCTVRTACSSLQLCFVILQLTALGIVLFGAASLYLAENAIEEITVATYVPAVLCIIVLLRLSMCAAFVSDLCKRVPMLVNSSNAEFDLKRMYLVEYIVHCETGFYIFEVRLSSALLLKVFYVACAATLGLLTQVVG